MGFKEGSGQKGMFPAYITRLIRETAVFFELRKIFNMATVGYINRHFSFFFECCVRMFIIFMIDLQKYLKYNYLYSANSVKYLPIVFLRI